MKIYQVAAIPMRQGPSGAAEVLLVTSRGSQRWLVPKGWPWRKCRDHDAAAGEAWEEAGVRGNIEPKSIGSYSYEKRWNGGVRRLEVLVYLLQVTEEVLEWPEAAERRRAWFDPAEAAELVAEPALKLLLRAL